MCIICYIYLQKRPHSAHSRPSSASSTAKGKKKHDDEDVLYKVAIITADKKDAGTDAKVCPEECNIITKYIKHTYSLLYCKFIIIDLI